MDTQTVFRIIEMIDVRLKVIEESFICYLDRKEPIDVGQQIGKEKALEELRDHLQDYIDNQVAHMETEQGM